MKRVYIQNLSMSNFKLQFIMNTFTDVRSQLIAELLDSHLSFESVRATATWDEMSCLEQMTLEDLMDM